MRKLLLVAALCCAGCGAKPKIVPNTPVALQELPPAVKQAVNQRFPGLKIVSARRTPSGDFDVSLRMNTGKTREMLVSARGDVLEAE